MSQKSLWNLPLFIAFFNLSKIVETLRRGVSTLGQPAAGFFIYGFVWNGNLPQAMSF
jgi:hypothetical protein